MKTINLFILNILIGISCSWAQNWSAVGNGVNSTIFSLATYNSKLYASGYFSYASGIRSYNIAQWNGVSWDSLAPQSNASGNILALTVYNGNLYCTNETGGVTGWDGTSWHPIGGGWGGPLCALAVYNGELYAGWQTTAYSGCEAISKWNGTGWTNVGSGINCSSPNANFSVRALTVYNGELYAGGYFNSAGGNTVHNIAKWNGTTWSALPTDTVYPIIDALGVYNGQLYIGGASPQYISKWNGITLDSVSSGMNGSVRSFCVYNNLLYVGGAFTMAGGNTTGNIATWNGTTWSSVNSGIDSSCVYTTCVYNGELYVGGTFINAGGVAANNIAKIDSANVGIKKINYNIVSSYPNPAQNNFTLKVSSNEKQQLQVFDITGKTILQQTILGTTTVDVSQLDNGVYFIQLKSDRTGVSTQKLLVQH